MCGLYAKSQAVHVRAAPCGPRAQFQIQLSHVRIPSVITCLRPRCQNSMIAQVVTLRYVNKHTRPDCPANQVVIPRKMNTLTNFWQEAVNSVTGPEPMIGEPTAKIGPTPVPGMASGSKPVRGTRSGPAAVRRCSRAGQQGRATITRGRSHRAHAISCSVAAAELGSTPHFGEPFGGQPNIAGGGSPAGGGEEGRA